MDTQAKDIDGPSGDAHGLEETQGAQGYYALEQLSDLAKSINLFTDALAAYRAQVEQLLSSGKNEAAYEIFRVMEQERKSLVACLLETRPYLLELEHPLAGPAEVLSKQLASFQLMTKDYSKLTGVPCPMSVLFASGNLHAKTLSSPAQTLCAAGNARIAAPPERRSSLPGLRCIAISKSGMARRFILGS